MSAHEETQGELLAEILSLRESLTGQRQQAAASLRGNEAFQQDALDSMTAHIAVLDRQGTIIAVNAAWTQFARKNGIENPDSVGVGVNYLDVCRKATGKFHEEAKAALNGIQAVLEGRERYFSLEYPCHSREVRRWFTMYVTPLSRPAGGVIVTHLNITERKEAHAALLRQHETLKNLLQSSDHERQTIAYEIHDGLAQYLAGAIMQFQTYDHLFESKPNLARNAFDAGMMLLKQGHSEARRLIAGVRPPVLDETGVTEAIAHLIQEQNREKGPQIRFQSKVNFNRLVPILENAIYRICQEGLSNACKFSQSSRVRITLRQQQDRLQIEIRDWGIGFDTKKAKEGSFGLTGIRQRVRLLQGKFHLRSAAGKGTRLRVELPLTEREE